MRVQIYKSMWGAVGPGARYGTFADAVPVISGEGWDGVGLALIASRFEPGIGSPSELAGLCREHDLGLAVMIHTWGTDPRDHLTGLRVELEEAAALDPHHVIGHIGLDLVALDDVAIDHFLGESTRMAADLGVTLMHETHRHRPLFNPWTTARILDRHPDLRLVADLSHWVVVMERLLEDEMEIVRRVGRHAGQIDARVGHEQSPQVSDPRAPEWQDHVDAFTAWWAAMLDEAEAAGCAEMVLVPEYGPPPYQQVTPHTEEPVADLWDVCDWGRVQLLELAAGRR